MANRAPKPPLKSPTPLSSRTASLKLILAAVVAVGAVGLLVYRTISTFKNSKPALLHLSEDVILGTPPPLPAKDKAVVRVRLRTASELKKMALASPNDSSLWGKAANAAMIAGDYLSARIAFLALIRLNSSPTAELYDALGQSQSQLGLREEALKTYGTMLTHFPQNASAYIGFSRAQSSFGQKAESLGTLEKAAKEMQTVPDRLHIAHEYEQKGDLAHALAESQAVLKNSPDDPLAMLMTGHLLFMLVRLPEAKQVFEKLTAAHPENSKAGYTLAEILDNPMTIKRDRAMAENILLEIAQSDPHDLKPYAKLGTIYMDQGHFRQAAYVYIRLLELVPNSALARLQLSLAFNKLGDPKSGQAQQEIAQHLLARDNEETRLQADTARHPTDAKARLNLARHYLKYGQYTNALPPLQAAYCLAPGNREIQMEMQSLYHDLNTTFP